MMATALIQLRPVDLDSAPDATGIDGQSALVCHLCHVRERDRVPQVPSHAPHNDVARIVAPFERVRGSDGQHSPYQLPCQISQRNPENSVANDSMFGMT